MHNIWNYLHHSTSIIFWSQCQFLCMEHPHSIDINFYVEPSIKFKFSRIIIIRTESKFLSHNNFYCRSKPPYERSIRRNQNICNQNRNLKSEWVRFGYVFQLFPYVFLWCLSISLVLYASLSICLCLCLCFLPLCLSLSLCLSVSLSLCLSLSLSVSQFPLSLPLSLSVSVPLSFCLSAFLPLQMHQWSRSNKVTCITRRPFQRVAERSADISSFLDGTSKTAGATA